MPQNQGEANVNPVDENRGVPFREVALQKVDAILGPMEKPL